MSTFLSTRKPAVDVLTVIAIAVISISLNVALHEGTHALTCLALGSDLQEYSALYVSCESPTVLQAKIVDLAAPTYNLIAGWILWLVLRRTQQGSPNLRYFLWLFMLMNWLYGSGYWMFSGFGGIGDMATVIGGWEPAWLWRVLLAVLGSAMFLFFVWFSLKSLGRIIGGEGEEQQRRVNLLSRLSYAGAFAVILLAGFFCPPGFTSLPVIAGLCAVLGALSPLLWMMAWFKSPGFEKTPQAPLVIQRHAGWITVGVVVVFLYTFILGRSLYF